MSSRGKLPAIRICTNRDHPEARHGHEPRPECPGGDA